MSFKKCWRNDDRFRIEFSGLDLSKGWSLYYDDGGLRCSSEVRHCVSMG